MKYLIICLVILFSFSASSQELNKDNLYYKIYEAAEKTLKNDAEGMRSLYKLSLEDHKDPIINKMLIKTTLLGMIRSNSKVIRKYILLVDSKFISLDSMAFLGRAPLQVKCYKCRGEGILKFPCKACFKGVCKNCRGKKQIVYEGLNGKVEVRQCIICKATGECITCDKSGTGQKACHVCVEKGTLFSSKAVPSEFKKSLEELVSFMPKYAASKDFLITDKMVELAKLDQLKKEKEEAARLAAERREKELAALEAERRAAREKRAEQARKAAASAPRYSGRDADLQHVLLEFDQFFRNRERISKQSIYESSSVEFKDGRPTLIINVTATVGAVNKSLKMQYLEAFFNFFKLRASSNGLGKNVVMIANYKKNQIATGKGDTVTLE